ncbi:TPA: hypothetical protein ACRL36_000760 [Pseudomonas aeruginosa]
MSTFFQEYTSGLTARADQLEHERDLLGQALGECIEAAGITNPGVALTGPQLLLFAEDLKAHIGGLRGQLADTAVPMQPLVKDAHGVARFKANKIVNHLLDYASERGCGMTELAKLQFPEEDYMQFAQLIGYSVSGYSDLSYVSDDSRGMAYAKLESLINDPSAQTQPSPAPTLRAAIDVANDRFEVPVAKWGTDLVGEQGRPKVVARLYRSNDKYFPPFAEVQKPLPPGDGTLTVDPLITLAHYDRDVGTLRAANAKLEKELAMARDAAAKGDAARHAAGGMEMEIRELKAKLAELEKPVNRTVIRDVFLRNGFTIKDGHSDLKPYVYAAAEELLRLGGHAVDSNPVAQAQHSVPDGAADLCRFLAKLYCELDGLRYSTAKLPAEQIADALIFKWPVLQGARNQLNIKRISEQPYDESKLHSAIAAMLAAAPGKEVPQAWLDVQAERRRQIEAEGWTPEHDDEHADGQMAQAAGCYALHAGGIGTDWPDGRQNGAALFWPWDRDSWKPTTPRRDMVKACALALAEIERLDRAAPGKEGV